MRVQVNGILKPGVTKRNTELIFRKTFFQFVQKLVDFLKGLKICLPPYPFNELLKFNIKYNDTFLFRVKNIIVLIEKKNFFQNIYSDEYFYFGTPGIMN